MPQVEQNPTFAEQQEKYTDLRDALSDGNLSDQEREELQERYYTDCEEVHRETASKCDDLRKEVEIYTEMSQMSQRDIEKLQILSGTNTLDGLRGPKTFGRYSLLTHNNPDFR